MKQLNVLNSVDTVNYILKHKCSIARFGDGEVHVMRGYSIGFQKRNKKLAKALKEVKTTDKCLLCIPDYFDKEKLSKKVLASPAYKFWKAHLFWIKPAYIRYFSKNSIMGNTEVSRFYIDYVDHSGTAAYVKLLKKLWQGRDLLIVEGQKTRMGIGNDFFDNAKSIRRILCPAQNAYDKIDQIEAAINQNLRGGELVLCAVGPTATVLAYKLSEVCQILDVGHIDIEYEWFLMGATEKVPIQHKYVNECKTTGRNPSECQDQQYLQQIVAKIN